MKKSLFIPFIVAGSMAVAAPAFADTASGEIKSVDATKRELVLTDGKTFHVSKKVDLNSFKAGQNVNITFKAKKDKLNASAVTAKQ